MHSPNPRLSQSCSVAFAFETGEVWAIDTSLLDTYPRVLFVHEIEDMLAKRLPAYRHFLMLLGLKPPYRWIAGVTGVKDRRLQIPPFRWPTDKKPDLAAMVRSADSVLPSVPVYQCVSEHIISEGTYDDKESSYSVLMPFFQEIYNRCGPVRPNYLPGAPLPTSGQY